jgi:iron complex transport system ATP-binding protein
VETFALFMAADQVGFTPVSVIDFKEVCLTRGGRQILGPITWRVDEGQRWVILGPNGAGKSTLFQLISTRIFPTTGSAQILDKDIGKV